MNGVDFEFMQSPEEIIKIKAKRKKILITALCVIAVLLLLLWLINLLFENRLNDEREQVKAKIDDENIWAGPFPEPDYNFNIFDDVKYTKEFDRDVWVYKSYDGTRTVITDLNRKDYTREELFMYDVINLIINGNYDEYNNLFTNRYLNSSDNNLREQFTMQQLYNIELETIDGREDGNLVYTDIMLTYRIRNNNGTFRTDLDFAASYSRPVVYILVAGDRGAGTIKIDNVMRQLLYESGLY